MKASDTVMKDPANLEWTEVPTDMYAADFSFIDDHPQEVQRICETQAEIAFKAGEEWGIKKGRSEVIEWIEEHRKVVTNTGLSTKGVFLISDKELQTFLKTKLAGRKLFWKKKEKDEVQKETSGN